MSAHAPPPPAGAPSASVTARRFFVLAVALSLMWALDRLRVDTGASGGEVTTLAAIGFVLLASFSVGQLGTSLGLPKVTGYIVAGALLGPQIANILSQGVVGEMRTFNTLALGLIATTAGLELDLPSIRKVGRTLAWTVLLKVLLLPLSVGGAFLLAHHLHPSFALPSEQAAIALALVIGVLGIGTSPAIALAVVNDSGARGRLTDLLLGIAVVKDVVVVTALAVAVAVAKALVGGGALDPSVLLPLAEELGASVAVGALVGGLLIVYFRYVKVEPLFSMAATILAVAELSQHLHLELLLVFIVAGFVVRNLSPYEDALLAPLERISLPVFIVFFTTAGAGIDLFGTIRILPLALLLMAVRVGVYWVSGRVAGRLGGEERPIVENAWLTWIPQAGVTLGLVMLAAKALPELSAPLTSLGLALVALNLLVGPVTLSLGLGRAGETAASRKEPQAPVADAAAPGEELAGPSAVGLDLHPALEAICGQVEADLTAEIDAFVEGTVQLMAQELSRWAAALDAGPIPGLAGLRQLRHGLDTARAPEDAGWAAQVATLHDRLADHVSRAPTSLVVPMEEALVAPLAGAGPGERGRRAAARLAGRLRRLRGLPSTRAVPVQHVLRAAIDPRLADAVVVLAASWWRARAEVSGLARAAVARGGCPDPEALAAPGPAWAAKAGGDLRFAVRVGLAEAQVGLARAGSPALPSAAVRLAPAMQRVEGALARCREEGPGWQERVNQAEDTLRAVLLVESTHLLLAELLGRRARAPVVAISAEILPELSSIQDALRSYAAAAASGPLDPPRLAEMQEALEHLLDGEGLTRLRAAAARFRPVAQPGPLLSELGDLSRNAPDTLRVVARATPVELARTPREVRASPVAFADTFRSLVLDDVAEPVSGSLGAVGEIVAACESRIREAVAVGAYGVELCERGGFEAEDERRAVLVEAHERAAARVEQLVQELEGATRSANEALASVLERASTHLRGLVQQGPPEAGARVRRSLRSSLQRLREAAKQAAEEIVRRSLRVEAAARSLGAQRSVRDLRIRSGHEPLDATGIRTYVDTFCADPASRGVPAVLARLLGPGAAPERRLFSAREAELSILMDAMSEQPARPAPSVLVVGPRGAGASTLLHLLQLQLTNARVLRLDPAFADRQAGPVGALAVELLTGSDPGAVAEGLGRDPAVVLIDGLEGWIRPDAQGVRQIEALLSLIDQTTPTTRWVVTMHRPAFALLGELVDLRHGFRRVLSLAPIEATEVGLVLAQRERLCGTDTRTLPTGLRRHLPTWFPARQAREAYLRRLVRVSQGNLGVALESHLATINAGPDGSLFTGEPRRPDLAPLAQLPASALATLVRLATFGPMEVEVLDQSVRGGGTGSGPRLQQLEHAGLICRVGAGARHLALVPRLEHALLHELADLHLLPGSSP